MGGFLASPTLHRGWGTDRGHAWLGGGAEGSWLADPDPKWDEEADRGQCLLGAEAPGSWLAGLTPDPARASQGEGLPPGRAS